MLRPSNTVRVHLRARIGFMSNGLSEASFKAGEDDQPTFADAHGLDFPACKQFVELGASEAGQSEGDRNCNGYRVKRGVGHLRFSGPRYAHGEHWRTGAECRLTDWIKRGGYAKPLRQRSTTACNRVFKSFLISLSGTVAGYGHS